MRKHVSRISIGFSVFVLVCSACIRNREALPKVDSGSEACLIGTVEKKFYPGPPNFGESPTDSKMPIWILTLSAPEHFSTGDSLISLRISNLSGADTDIAKFAGVRVIAKGKLSSATTPGDVTPVVFEYAKLAVADGQNCGDM
jgi:hypothetical protein